MSAVVRLEPDNAYSCDSNRGRLTLLGTRQQLDALGIHPIGTAGPLTQLRINMPSR